MDLGPFSNELHERSQIIINNGEELYIYTEIYSFITRNVYMNTRH
jgi:hypothetical protein